MRSGVFWDITQHIVIIPDLEFLILEDGTERLSWKVGNELPLYTV